MSGWNQKVMAIEVRKVFTDNSWTIVKQKKLTKTYKVMHSNNTTVQNPKKPAQPAQKAQEPPERPET